MIVANHIPTEEREEALTYYTTNHKHVAIVSCSKCEKELALEVSAENGMQGNARGMAVLPLSDDLLSSRVRLDETPEGEPMMGYRCICGNDTRLSEAELHHEPKNGWGSDLLPHEAHKVKEAIKQCGEHKADYAAVASHRRYETFAHEVIK